MEKQYFEKEKFDYTVITLASHRKSLMDHIEMDQPEEDEIEELNLKLKALEKVSSFLGEDAVMFYSVSMSYPENVKEMIESMFNGELKYNDDLIGYEPSESVKKVDSLEIPMYYSETVDFYKSEEGNKFVAWSWNEGTDWYCSKRLLEKKVAQQGISLSLM